MLLFYLIAFYLVEIFGLGWWVDGEGDFGGLGFGIFGGTEGLGKSGEWILKFDWFHCHFASVISKIDRPPIIFWLSLKFESRSGGEGGFLGRVVPPLDRRLRIQSFCLLF